MRLFVRRSEQARAEAEFGEFSRTNRDGLAFLSKYFDYPFPFPKYDLVLIPGFPYGGMEHAGASFFNEEAILLRAAPTANDRLRRATLILHEMAHQWFGDLVTMRWFDDLWLKEGFATYMSYLAADRLMPDQGVWRAFYNSVKPAAYAIDVTRGTTPIYQQLANLNDAKSAYGAIVYNKAPAILRQLSFLIGEDAFRSGVRRFLKKHEYSNAEWSDLISAYEQASEQSLQQWAEVWVRRRGLPRIETEWRCDEAGRISRLALRQRDTLGEGGFWPMKLQVLTATGNALRTVTVTIEGESAVVNEAKGSACPEYVFANAGDYGYGQFLLDERSRSALRKRLGSVRDEFLRTLLWGALWDSVREAELAPLAYIKLGLELLPSETDEQLAGAVMANIQTAFNYYLSNEQRSEIAPQLESLFFDRMMKATGQGMRITYFRAFQSVAMTEKARGQLKSLLAGAISIPGVPLRPVDRWRIITALLARDDSEADSLFDSERERDKTDDGRKYAYVAEAARARQATKQRYFDSYLHDQNVPEDWVQESIRAFNSPQQAELTIQYLAPALRALPEIKRGRKIFFLLNWLRAFIGGQWSEQALRIVQAHLRNTSMEADTERKVLEVMDGLERSVKIRAKFANRG